MSLIPTIPVISGSGKPRLVLVVEPGTEIYTSIGATTFAANSVTEAAGSPVNVVSSSAANPTELETSSAHGLSVNQWVRIAGHTSTPDINGDWKVEAVPSSTEFRIAANVTGAGGATGTIKRIPAFLARGIVPNMRVRGSLVAGALSETVYAKIMAIDDTNGILTVDSWIGGTPTNGQTIVIDGWVADLPRCNSLRESFTPDQIVHQVYRARKSVKRYGYIYSVELNYSVYVSGDTLLLLRPMLSPKKNDRLVVIPRIDVPEYQYNVYMSNSVELELFGEGLGHRGFRMVLEGTESIPDLPMNSSGYGFSYGSSYGDQL